MARIKLIKITNISKDKQRCIDTGGTIYKLTDVKAINLKKVQDIKNRVSTITDISVTVAHTQDGREYIKYKKNCKEKIFSGNPDYTIKPIYYNLGNSGKIYNLTLITEDSSSANKIIINIIEKFALSYNIQFNLKAYHLHGYSLINYYVSRAGNNDYVLVIYDGAINSVDIKNIDKSIDFNQAKGKGNYVRFLPKCSEECILSFKRLSIDIKNISSDNKKLIQEIENYYSSGTPYMNFKLMSGRYEFIRLNVPWGYKSAYTGKTINNVEQYLSDRVADITYNNPYDFNKSTGLCWLHNCKSLKNRCKWEDLRGSKNPKNVVNNCNMTLLNDDKTLAIVNESLFGGIWDALLTLLGAKNCNRKLNKIVYNDTVRRF